MVDSNPANMAIYLAPRRGQPGWQASAEQAHGRRSAMWRPLSGRPIRGPSLSSISPPRAQTIGPRPTSPKWISPPEQSSSIAATNAAEKDPVYSPDGKYLAYTKSSDPPRWADDDRIVLVTRASAESRTLPASYDEQPNLLGFTADSSRLIFIESRHTRTAIYAMPVDGPPQTVFETSKGVIGAGGTHLNAAGTHLGMPMESTEEPPEAYVLKVAGGTPMRLSRANTDLPKLPLGKTEPIRWKSKDGLDIEGLLTYPVNYEQGKKYPLILNIHGGPTGIFSETFTGRSGLYPIAVFAARGYAVLRPNPAAARAATAALSASPTSNDWGGKDFEDDQTGVDHVISMGIADPDRLAVMGWSYGGFMTSWTITQTHRFKAAVVGAGVTDLWSFTGTADIPGFLPDYFGGEPWTQFENFQKHSPITYVKNRHHSHAGAPRRGGRPGAHFARVRILSRSEAPGRHGKDGGLSAAAARAHRAEIHSRHHAASLGLGGQICSVA